MGHLDGTRARWRAANDAQKRIRSRLDGSAAGHILRDTYGCPHGRGYLRREPYREARCLRSPGRTRYGAPLLSIARWEMGVAGGDGYRSLVGALPLGSRRRGFLRTQGRSAWRRLYIRRVVAGWEVDVLHIERGGRKSHLAAAFS